MSTTDATSFGRAVCRAVLDAADLTIDRVNETLRGQRSLVRTNWLAYQLWFARCLAAQDMTDDELTAFSDALGEQLADREGPAEPRRTRILRFLVSRIEGYEEALDASKEAETIGPIMNYLIACSSTPRLVIRYSDIRATPACLRSVSEKMSLDATARRQLEESIAEPRFAYYLPDLNRDATLEAVMHEASAHVADAVEHAHGTLAQTKAS